MTSMILQEMKSSLGDELSGDEGDISIIQELKSIIQEMNYRGVHIPSAAASPSLPCRHRSRPPAQPVGPARMAAAWP
jgi:hypothetical protein